MGISQPPDILPRLPLPPPILSSLPGKAGGGCTSLVDKGSQEHCGGGTWRHGLNGGWRKVLLEP